MESTWASDVEGLALDHGVAVAVAVPKKTKTNNNKAKRHTFPRLTCGDSHPFIEQQDKKDLAIFKCLVVSKPFAVGKGHGITEAWTAAVEEINAQPDDDGTLLFNPPVSVKTVRDRFDGAMKIVATLDNNVPFRSGLDDEDAPNELQTLLEDLLSMCNSFNTAALEVKDSTVAKKKKDRESAKAIQQAAIGNWVSLHQPTPDSDDDASGDNSDKKSSVNSASKRNRVSIGDKADTIREMLEERRANRKAKMEARQLEQQQQQQLMQQQLQVSLQMVAMLKALTDQLNNRNN